MPISNPAIVMQDKITIGNGPCDITEKLITKANDIIIANKNGTAYLFQPSFVNH